MLHRTQRALVLDNLGLVRRLARVVRGRYSLDIDISELESYGYMGLVEAASRYRAEKNVPFSGYARRRIYGAIIDGLGESGPTPRRRSQTSQPQRGHPSPELVKDEASNAFESLSACETASRVRAAIIGLPQRHRTFVERRYWDDDNLTDIGRDLGISKSRASRVHSKALRLLREALTAA